jgi:alpha-tubulin suppressor-like RCC1 family protein
MGTSRDTMASTFQIYSTENALFTTIDKNKTLVYSWGSNQFGQLGLKDDRERSQPTLIEAVLEYNFKRASCGYNHTVLFEENGQLYACGNNAYGQIGNKNNNNQLTPISIF